MNNELDIKKITDIIYLDDVRKSMVKGFNEGYEMGKTTYFRDIDEHFKWLLHNLIVFAGYGNHGKSILLKQLLLASAVRRGQKTAIFSPEDMPANYFYDDLIHTLVGKSTLKQHSNQMTIDEYHEAMDFIKDHFFLLYPEKASPTPEYINMRFKEAIEKHGVEYCVTDPFNQLDNHWQAHGGRDDKYLSSFLSKEKRFAQDHDIYKIIVAHCKSEYKTDDNDGSLKNPTVFTLANGAMWNNKVDDIVIIHRPYKHINPSLNMTVFISDKIKKQKLCGIPGTVDMSFNIMTNRFLIDNVDIFGNEDIKTTNLIDEPDLTKIRQDKPF